MRWVKAFGSLIVLLALLIGIPAALGATIGNPMDVWPDLKVGDLTTEVWIALVSVIVWVAWAQFAVSVLLEFAAAARALPKPGRIHLVPGVSQNLARVLVGAVLLAGTAGAALATPVHALAAIPSRAPAAATAATLSYHAELSNRAPTSTATSQSPPAVAPETTAPRGFVSYVVPSDGNGPDNYWDIAVAYCGDGENWSKIWEANQGRTQADGSVMNQRDVLKSGWTVLVPREIILTPPNRTPAQTVTVNPGDTLSAISASHGVTDWHRAWDVSQGMPEPGGQRFTDPNLMQPGWTLKVPIAAAVTVPAARHPAPHTTSVHPPVRTPATTVPDTPSTPTTPVLPSATPVSPTAPASPATPTAPSAAQPAHTSAAVPAAERPTRASAELPMVAFAGGGVLLAGVSLAALMRYRRRQFRWRHPGRTISATPPGLLRVERALLSAGSVGIADVTWLNEALRSLVHALSARADARLPDVVAARMTAEELELVLTSPQPGPPAPWTADEQGNRWSIRRDDTLTYDPADRPYHFAPFPTLASVGYTAGGEHWLLDLERVAATSLSGDPERCLNLARFLAAELAHNAWSEMLQVTLVGFGKEMAEINPDRLTYTDSFAEAIAGLEDQLGSVNEAMRECGVDVLTGRLRDVAGDMWAPHVLLVAPGMAADATGLEQLLTAMKAQRSRTAVALVLADDPDHADATRWQLNVDAGGVLRIPALGVELIAQQIPAEEAAELAQMLALAATTLDRPVPAARGTQAWDGYADAAGGLRPEISARFAAATGEPARSCAADVPALHLADAAPWMSNSVLPLSPQTYLDRTATTSEDVEVLAPPVDEELRREVEDADPNLDADLADWYDPACTRPKVRLLGPVAVTAQGPLPSRNPRIVWNTEVLAYLSTRPNGVPSERYGTDLWPNDPDINGKTKVRQSIVIARKWLGVNERTGQPYLPKGTTSKGSIYRVEDVLVDAELFRRLRLRGSCRGPAGIADLRAALDLVIGIPLDKRRPGGYGWLADTPLDHEYSGMIEDTAHTVATHHLATGEPELAAAAAQVTLRAGSSSDVPLLDMVAACDAQDNRGEADAYVKLILSNHDAEVEEDLPPRTAEILFRRQWIGEAS